MIRLLSLLIGLSVFCFVNNELAAKPLDSSARFPKDAVLSYIPAEVTKVMVVSGTRTKESRQAVQYLLKTLGEQPRFKKLQDGKQLGDITRLNDVQIAAKAREADVEFVLILRSFDGTLVGTALLAEGRVWGGFSLSETEVLTPRDDVKSAGEGLSNDTLYSIYGHQKDGGLTPEERKKAENKYRENYLHTNADVSAVFEGTSSEPLDPLEFFETVEDDAGIKLARETRGSYSTSRGWGVGLTAAGAGLALLSSQLAGSRLSEDCSIKVDPADCEAHKKKENDAVDKAAQQNVIGGLVLAGAGGYLLLFRAPRMYRTYTEMMYIDKKKVQRLIEGYNNKLLKKLKLPAEPADLQSKSKVGETEPEEPNPWHLFVSNNPQAWLLGVTFQW